ncbi:Por secretion system C-terminal sorting domain-containing protein [Tangfeifania diversioriginum]|uniref:Por secretion system C-terminal sorting domain-containing protein n=1 Tax=Tangfeifania diversioriginum TaxID=1168035 RepID=A0A1M6H0H9_9BACT|nr:choice-of-anchor J domain-containing protein [Tangfeifania diversioriginum]SHJ15696.1 Por secretion system C-terminal sorting domain-containing protein [Tangfeifania diversioriginum]
MKTIFTFLLSILLLNVLSAQSLIDLPFFDDFEETIQEDATFQNWTTENLEGWHYWHIVPGQYMRFENNDLAQNDWLITKKIVGEDIENVIISFNILHVGDGIKPKLFFTNKYNGNANESNWTEIIYSLGDHENEWFDTGEISIENPGDTLYFGFHYQAAANAGIYLLLDNFKVVNYKPLIYETVGSSEHFEFCTNMPDSSSFYLAIQDVLENQYDNLTSLWDRPGIENLFPDTSKIKVIYSQKADLNIEVKDYPWKLGFHNRGKMEIYLSPISNEIQKKYYKNLAGLAVNEFSQLTVSRQFMRENMLSFPDYFLEGFGLYECGVRPQQDSLLNLMNELGTNVPPMSAYQDLSNMPSTSLKDLLVFCIEAKVLADCYYSISPYGYEYGWAVFLKHFYQNESPERIKLQHTTSQFNIYSSDNEIPFVEAIGNEFELKLDSLQEQYQLGIPHKWNICIYTEPVGMEIMGYNDYFNGGSAFWGDKIALITPIGADMDVYLYSLMHHEFMHTFFSHFYYNAPGGFFNEGIADFANGPLPDPQNRIEGNRWKLVGMFNWYQDNVQRDPAFQEIVDNFSAQGENGFDPDIYMLGHLFYTFLFYKYADYVKIREFWNRGKDYSVFGGKTEEEIGLEYVQFLKELAYYGPPRELKPIPFTEDFETYFDGWSILRYKAHDFWSISENSYEGDHSAYAINPYWLDEKDADSWMISPTLDASDAENVFVSFYYNHNGTGINPEIYYAENFTSIFDSTNWTKINDLSWNSPEGEWAQKSFTIQSPPEKLNIAFRFVSTDGNYVSHFIDNFYVKNRLTGSKHKTNPTVNLNIHPNPATSESIISFQTQTAGKVNLSIFDIQGRKICTLLNKKLNAGMHTIPVSNSLTTNGVYFCELQTSEGILTKKLIINAK